MAVYRFRYASKSGSAVRTTIMQCDTDEEAVRKASDTMQDSYISVEIFDGERLVETVFARAQAISARQTPQSS